MLTQTEYKVLECVDVSRLDASSNLDIAKQGKLGQFLTPAPVARLMASMFESIPPEVRLLDAGAGVGSLTAAFVNEVCGRKVLPKRIAVTLFEIDPFFLPYIENTMKLCADLCESLAIDFSSEVFRVDFVEAAVEMLTSNLFTNGRIPHFNCTILNPPYGKISTDSTMRLELRKIGIETSNLYSGFLATAIRLLDPAGQLVAITPRSFCNGTYFKSFRLDLLEQMAIQRIHVFESRNRAFKGDEVLQENVILSAVKSVGSARVVEISSSLDASDPVLATESVDFGRVVRPNDPDRFIHLETSEVHQDISNAMQSLTHTLEQCNLSVSTGGVVDFRQVNNIRLDPIPGAIPLIYPAHFSDGGVQWPKTGKKPNAILLNEGTEPFVLPMGNYVLVKRFSTKEEPKRIVAVVFDSANFKQFSHVAFENHINVYHHLGAGLDLELAQGLACFLNSTIVDTFFRQFNGHTQVNAGDLRKIRYPSPTQLAAVGQKSRVSPLNQTIIDDLIEREIQSRSMGNKKAVHKIKRVKEAELILKALGLPREQQNERSALTLLSLLDIKPNGKWAEASNPLRGITPMMDFFAEHYGKRYKPNTRETVRRQTVHQMLDAGLIVINPDEPNRSVNSPKSVYQIENSALLLLRGFGTVDWEKDLKAYRKSKATLQERYAQERKMARIPVTISEGHEVQLSPGGQNILVEQIVHEFAPRFTPGAKVIYLGDTDEKFAYFDESALKKLGVKIDTHGKMPDVIVFYGNKKWLVLIEAVTSHGPINPKRRDELRRIFQDSKAGIVYVTAFLSKKVLREYISDISWETEVWVAESPSHLIHFNGERFLGPYED